MLHNDQTSNILLHTIIKITEIYIKLLIYIYHHFQLQTSVHYLP
jgi:hypothetical protein